MNKEEEVRIPISVVIITKNEEEKLPGCLESISFADDVVVVDSGSSDRTVEIAKSYGARVFVEPWQGFSYQKQFAVDHGMYDWVFILDADERIPEETASQLSQILKESCLDVNGFSFRRKNYFHGSWVKHCGWWPNRVLRLVDRRKGSFDGRSVHESWVANGPVKALDCAIIHLSFRNYSEMITKLDLYTNIGACDLYGKNRNSSALKPITHGLWMFLKVYILEQGFRDGFDGLVISLMHGAGSFFKYAKHREITKYSARLNDYTIKNS
ncbi:MAG: glycosyltransferase family 2 protein [Desulfobulbaceae bacterium]|nr:glycosyltransferase family 2 protein [Desulfobulbaceae bacterium]